MSEDITRLHRRIAELGEQSQRYRTAWMSARNRARSYATDLEAHMDWSDDMQDERNALRAERSSMIERCARLEMERDEAQHDPSLLVVQQRDDARTALERVAVERDEARAEVVRLGKENEEHRRTIRAWQAAREADEAEFEAWLKRANDGINAALAEQLTDEQVEERIERIKQTARERRAARGALQEHIERPDR